MKLGFVLWSRNDKNSGRISYTRYTWYLYGTIHSDMVDDPEYTTGLYQREAQTLWIVTSSSECYI